MKFAYPFTPARRAVVVTTDLPASNLQLLKTDHWLSERGNLEVVRLICTPWQQVAPQIETPAQQMERWTVLEAVAFLKANDLEGPAQVLYAHGVRGQDLARLTNDDLEKDLKLSRFTASRVHAAKLDFLQL